MTKDDLKFIKAAFISFEFSRMSHSDWELMKENAHKILNRELQCECKILKTDNPACPVHGISQ